MRSQRRDRAVFSSMAAAVLTALAACPPDSAGQGPRTLPVVFVPGTSGSRLVLPDGAVFWIDSSSLSASRVPRGSLNAQGGEEGVEDVKTDGIVDAVAFVPPPSVSELLGKFLMSPTGERLTRLPVYQRFTDWGRQTFGADNWFDAPYDWRKGAGPESSAEIDAAVERALQATGAKKVILVAHSLGGLACRDYIAGVGKGKVDALVSVGTPWLGALKSARGLAWGYNFGVGFTSKDTPFVPNLYWYVKDPLNGGRLTRFDPPLRLSFLSNDATAALAKNYPCVFQQLPTDDHMALYGKSVIYGMTPEQASATLRSFNPTLYDASLAWRRDHMKDDDFGVAHLALAGLCDPKGDPGEFHEMQMAMPGPDSLTARGGGIFDSVNNRVINERRKLFDDIKNKRIPLYLDEFIATDRDVAYGDGTSPLLSASAGAQVRDGGPFDATKAAKYLGQGAQVRVLYLERPYSHGSMVNDLGVRQEILRFVSERRKAAGLPEDPRAGDVGLMTLELTTKGGNPFNGTVEPVTMWLGDNSFTTNIPFQNGQVLSDGLTAGESSRYFYHAPSFQDPVTLDSRPLRRSDLQGIDLVLRKSGFTNWTCSRVRLFLDGQPVLEDSTEFSLRGNVTERRIPIRAAG